MGNILNTASALSRGSHILVILINSSLLMAVDMVGLPQRRASRFRFRESPTFILLTVCVAIFNVSVLGIISIVTNPQLRMSFFSARYVV